MTVELNEHIPTIGERPRVTITSDKFLHEFTVAPADTGFMFYEVSVPNGKVPKVLEGLFSTMKAGVQAVVEYERTAKPSPRKVTKDRYDAKDAAKTKGNTD